MIRLDKRVLFERQAEREDPNGNIKQEWGRLIDLAANVRETPGREAIAAGRLGATNTATVWIRRGDIAASITVRDRMIHRGIVWAIRSAIPSDKGDRIIELTVETEGERHEG